MPPKANYPPGFGLQNQLAYSSQQVNTQGKGITQAQYTSGTSIESLIKEYMAKNDVVIQSQQASLQNLEVQVGQLATELRNRPLGKLPADTETPKREGKEQCQAIELRSGKKIPSGGEKNAEQGDSHSQETADTQQRNDEAAVQKEHSKDYAKIKEQPKIQTTASSGQESITYTPSPPFPQRIKRKKEEAHFEKFMDILKEIHINIPRVEALKQMPNYVKFLKDVLTNRRKFEEFKVVSLNEECSAILKNKIPLKEKDPGSFTIPVSIGGKELGRALCDLGASINLMPLSIYKKLGIGEARPTTVTLQLADRSITYPEGKIEDILIQVDKFIFPADFIILDYEADHDVPIILGRPFLKTGRTLVDVYKGTITLRMGDQKVEFNINDSMKYPAVIEECSTVTEECTSVYELTEQPATEE
ncbi:uncharacterized protein LOC111454344 [Cucurbita moschata]|uniref:Uncharacterized protein LOC111454344 n=1 Tax=Cucurbita moschata TaxID=3662 RepID=A0A6J1GJ68_CUCMO|nr:uncharacterized protein LOC111454344 [Cucurbita moschata]